MKKLKVLSAFVLTVSLLCACSTADSKPAQSETPSTAEAETVAEETTVAPETTVPEMTEEETMAPEAIAESDKIITWFVMGRLSSILPARFKVGLIHR